MSTILSAHNSAFGREDLIQTRACLSGLEAFLDLAWQPEFGHAGARLPFAICTKGICVDLSIGNYLAQLTKLYPDRVDCIAQLWHWST